MFEQSLVRADDGRRRPAAVAVSLALQAAGLGALALVPLWRYAALPSASAEAAVVAPPALAAPATPARRALATQMVRLAAVVAPPLTAPAAIPTMAAARTAMQPLPGAQMGVAGGAGSGPPAAWLGTMRSVAPAPPGAAGMIRVGGEVQAARCMTCPPPHYPALARMAGVSGVVALAAVIGTDGRVTELRLLSGPPLLVAAALRAVRRWRYRPTELNGKPVSVKTAIRVAFRLGRR